MIFWLFMQRREVDVKAFLRHLCAGDALTREGIGLLSRTLSDENEGTSSMKTLNSMRVSRLEKGADRPGW